MLNGDQNAEHSSLGHMPTGRWIFDESVTSVFSDMLARSIPQYEVMRKSVTDLGMSFVQPGSSIVDLGCSRGDALAPFVSTCAERNSYVGVEVSAPMLGAARLRFQEQIARGYLSILDLDLRNDYPRTRASLTLSILSLQFTPIEHRQRILQDVYANTVAGGAFILVEKVLGSSASVNTRMTELYHAGKLAAGYTSEEVQRKKLSLEGVLVPVTARWNEELLLSAGFKDVDCFWRWMNFAGWIAIKP